MKTALSPFVDDAAPALDPAKFRDPGRTASGAVRASVAFQGLDTLWFNTGTLCNLTCRNCYIESSPRNDALGFLSAGEVAVYLDEIAALGWRVPEIGFTGGEPFVNAAVCDMLEDALARGHAVLVLTNAMRPMRLHEARLLALAARFGARLTLRVSLDHYSQAVHEAERGAGSWTPAIDGLGWLARHGFAIAVAGRQRRGEQAGATRAAYARLFAERGLPVDALDPARLTLFPEMDAGADIPEISDGCWGILHKSPASVMCASSRMVVKRRGEAPSVVACTLLPYDAGFATGRTLAESTGRIALNHPHCARFCVLGGASCSG